LNVEARTAADVDQVVEHVAELIAGQNGTGT
jgi:hypothetical protein